MTGPADAVSRELDEKNKVIAHLTKTLAQTRACLEIARTALESIADAGGESNLDERHARIREIALGALRRI
jgi:hypothetical protein